MKHTPYHPQYPHLCQCLHIGNLTLRNRMCSAPMGFPDLTEDGCLTEGAIAFYEKRAKGGAAIVTISEAAVDYLHGKSHGRLINLQNPGVLAGLTNAARAIRRHGAIASIELNHSGMLSEFDVAAAERTGDGLEHWGPMNAVLPDGSRVVGMNREMIRETVNLYKNGAALIKRAGFDMVMIHAGHGWLIHQFLSELTNQRTDEYGGSIENRSRLCIEILDAVREAVGPGFPIEVRFSGIELAKGGFSQQDAIAFACLIQDKCDILHVSAGGEPEFHTTHPSMFDSPGCNVYLAEEIRKHVHIPVATLGALNEPEQMERILTEGKADIVCMARALLADPELPHKVEQNRTDEILRCCRCFTCHAERMLTQTRVCALNPEIGREYEAKFTPPITNPKRILVVGGGPAGMQSSLTAAQRGHKVLLCEKTDRLGGQLNNESETRFKTAFPKYIATMKRRMELAGVEIHYNTTITPEYVREYQPDALIVAVGASPIIPLIPGIDRKNVYPASEAFMHQNEFGHRIVILGGGQVGCEAAIHFAQRGHSVVIAERRPKLAPDANPRHRPALMRQLNTCNEIHTDLTGKAIIDKGLLCVDSNGKEILLEADTILIACGLRSRSDLVDSLRGTAPVVEIIGDCNKPGTLREATFRAYHAALDL